jgi:hypothetical protein
MLIRSTRDGLSPSHLRESLDSYSVESRVLSDTENYGSGGRYELYSNYALQIQAVAATMGAKTE